MPRQNTKLNMVDALIIVNFANSLYTYIYTYINTYIIYTPLQLYVCMYFYISLIMLTCFVQELSQRLMEKILL